MHYSVKRRNGVFELEDERGQVLGVMSYGRWWPMRAEIVLSDRATYRLEPAGFWQTRIQVDKAGATFAEIQPLLGRGFRLSFASDPQSYLFRKRSLWNMDYGLLDEQDQEIAQVMADFNWKILKYEYRVEVLCPIADSEISQLLPLLLAYTAGYYRTRGAGGA